MASPVPEAAVEAERIARAFHEAYERLAPDHGYMTRRGSAKPWEEVLSRNRRLMVAVARELLDTGTLIAVPEDEDGRRELVERAVAAYRSGPPTLRRAALTTHETAIERALQALGLLPEQEPER